jgi:carbonic anhydrase/acetyltransferase-like protein (isoleucine patch superfamily)
MKKTFFAICVLFAASAFAQEVFPFVAGTYGTGFDRDHQWTQNQQSNRFVIYWSDTEAPITANARQTALNELELIYDSYMTESKFQPPFTRNPNDKKKMGIYVLREGEGHAFGGTSAGGPGMWLSAAAVSDKWALAHEFMHGLQQATGGLPGGNTNQAANFIGWFHESHANLMPHQVYKTEVHYCAEMYTRTAELYLGSTRNRYCNWQFFEHVIDVKGVEVVNDIWAKSVGQNGTDPMAEIMRQNSMSQKDFNDLFGEFATKAVIWDMKRGSALFRNAYNGVNDRFKRQRYAYLEALDSTDGANGRFVSPFMFSPQRYGFNIIRLYPNASNSAVTVKFRGDVQTQNNIPNYARVQNLEPTTANLPNDPQSDWRYGLVAVTGDAASRTGTVTARYSPVMRASDDNPDVSITMQNGETQLYLVVAATPKIHHKITWDQYFYTIYRFPYMVEISGAKPDGFQTIANTNGAAHSNGGGFVQSTATVASTAYVGPNARVTGTARVQNNARIEGRAVVSGGTVQNDAIVKDYAKVSGGTISGSAIISEHANILGGTFSGNARVYGFPVITTGTVTDSAHVGGVGVIEAAINLSGTAQLQGDIEVGAFIANKGVYFGIVGEDKTIGENRAVADYGGPVPKREVTKPRSMQWYGESVIPPSSSSSSILSSSSATPSSSSTIVTQIRLPQTVVNNHVTLIHNGINLQAASVATVEVYGLNGNLISRQNFNAGVYSVSLNHLSKGLYIVKVSFFGGGNRKLSVPVM